MLKNTTIQGTVTLVLWRGFTATCISLWRVTRRSSGVSATVRCYPSCGTTAAATSYSRLAEQRGAAGMTLSKDGRQTSQLSSGIVIGAFGGLVDILAWSPGLFTILADHVGGPPYGGGLGPCHLVSNDGAYFYLYGVDVMYVGSFR